MTFRVVTFVSHPFGDGVVPFVARRRVVAGGARFLWAPPNGIEWNGREPIRLFVHDAKRGGLTEVNGVRSFARGPYPAVAQHLENYRMPRLQRHVIRILWMVPIYAVDCWLALRFKECTIYFDTIRECYEAYVIYNFYTYCTVYLQEFCNPGLEQIVARKPQQGHFWPVRLFVHSPRMGEPFLRLCRHGVINYVVMRPVTTALAFITEANGLYGDGQILNPLVAFPYLTLVNNLSQAWAMYCLILFYKVTHEELAPIRPFAKFLTVKAVVFLSFWQGQLILLLVKMRVIRVKETWTDYDAADVATGMQEFAICIEMFFAAVAHAYAFPPSEYATGAQQVVSQRKFIDNVRDMFDLRDVYHDLVNFTEANKDRLVRKWERVKGVCAALRYGLQAPLSAAAKGGDDALTVMQAYSRLEDPAEGSGAGVNGTNGGGGVNRRASEDRGTEVALFAGGATPSTSPRGNGIVIGGEHRNSGVSGGGGGGGAGNDAEEPMLGAVEADDVLVLPVAPLEREARFGSQEALWRPGSSGV